MKLPWNYSMSKTIYWKWIDLIIMNFNPTWTIFHLSESSYGFLSHGILYYVIYWMFLYELTLFLSRPLHFLIVLSSDMLWHLCQNIKEGILWKKVIRWAERILFVSHSESCANWETCDDEENTNICQVSTPLKKTSNVN